MVLVHDAAQSMSKESLLHCDRRTCWRSRKGILFGFAATGCVTLILTCALLSGFRTLGDNEQILVYNQRSRYVENGPAVVYVNPFVQSELRKACVLDATQYIVVKETLRGTRIVHRGPGMIFLQAWDESSAVKEANLLKNLNYLRVTNNLTGEVRMVYGPQLYFPTAYEDVVEGWATVLDNETAALVRSLDSGALRLIAAPSPFFPRADENVVEVRHLTRVADYEAIVVRDVDGKLITYLGRSFFLPPYSEVLHFWWTIGGDVKENHKYRKVDRIDIRMQQLHYEFDDIRTTDNMDFRLEGVIFWKIVHVRKVVRATADPTKDIWYRLRAQVAKGASNYTYAQFMPNVSSLLDAVFAAETAKREQFYSSRGIVLRGLELYKAAPKSKMFETEALNSEKHQNEPYLW